MDPRNPATGYVEADGPDGQKALMLAAAGNWRLTYLADGRPWMAEGWVKGSDDTYAYHLMHVGAMVRKLDAIREAIATDHARTLAANGGRSMGGSAYALSDRILSILDGE